MSCECVKQLAASLKERHGESVRLDVRPTLRGAKIAPWFKPVKFTFLEMGKRRTGYLTVNFCPFCGKERA